MWIGGTIKKWLEYSLKSVLNYALNRLSGAKINQARRLTDSSASRGPGVKQRGGGVEALPPKLFSVYCLVIEFVLSSDCPSV